MATITIYIAVRKHVTGEWPDISTASYDRNSTIARAAADDKRLVKWASENPLERIGEFTATEVTKS